MSSSNSNNNNNNNPYSLVPSKILGIQFSMLSNDEIVRGSVADITTRDILSGGKPVIGGLSDPRMGPLDANYLCPTDGLNYMECPGYHGSLELAVPIFQLNYFPDIIKTLNCICFNCSKLRFSKENHPEIMRMAPEKRADYAHMLSEKVKRCGDSITDGCGMLQPNYKKEGFGKIYAVWKEGANKSEKKILEISARIAMSKFQRITDEDCLYLGYQPLFSRPENMISTHLLIPPLAVRPSVQQDSQQHSEDDITHILINIIKINAQLVKKIQNNYLPALLQDSETLLLYYVSCMKNNKISQVEPLRQKSGRPLKSITDRLGAKTGRMRGNLMAKRVDFSARSVITADPNISISEIGIPIEIAMNLTLPILVNNRNRSFLCQLILNGPDTYPGANSIIKHSGGNPIDLRYIDRKSIVAGLEIGDTINRHMMNGDMFLFNRQPTLHRMSMMGHKAVIMKHGKTFRMNVGVTAPYNADFDGDEMNLHLPQSIEAETELFYLAAVPYQIISPANNSPIIGIFQDSMLGCYLFTQPKVRLDPKLAMNLLIKAQHIDVDLLQKSHLSSFEVLSQILPPMTLKNKNKQFDDSGEKSETSNHIIEIVNGNYLRGLLDAGTLKSCSTGILQRICNDFGNQACANFIDNLQNIITPFMISRGFSVGISDLMSDNKTNEAITSIIVNKKKEVKNMIDQLQLGIFPNLSGRTNEEEFEAQVNNLLNQTLSETGKLALKSLSKDNAFVVMAQAGSKGKDINITQMMACVGQQNVDGKRIPLGFLNRTLPHFTQFDDTPSARGFVESSFVNGLNPVELFFHAMGGRIGLIDTAVKTSTTGYIQRQLIKALEDQCILHDMTIRNNLGKIIQFRYGDTGMNTIKVEKQFFPLMELTLENIYAHYQPPEDPVFQKTLSQLFLKPALLRFNKQKEAWKEQAQRLTQELLEARPLIVKNVFKSKMEKMLYCPVNFQAIIQNVIGQQSLGGNSLVDLTPLEALEKINQCYYNLTQIHCAPPFPLFKILYYYYLSPNVLLFQKRINAKALDILLTNLSLMYKRAIVAPGEMVGMVAAQSIGEPTTQMTLNSFVYETEILVRNSKGRVSIRQLGSFVQEHIEKSSKIEYYSDKETTYAELNSETEFYEIPSCDENGEVSWKRIEAVTKHPVINEDGTNTMLRVITDEEREVIATKAKSFLKLVNGKIIGVNGSELKVGDYLPISTKTIDFTPSTELDLRLILPPTEYLYASEMKKAEKYINVHHWWLKHNNIDFVVPYNRSDSCLNRLQEEATSLSPINNNCVYSSQGKIVGHIPERIPLDYDFGYLVGAYAAEGCMTNFQISISNNDIEYHLPIQRLCKKWNITTKLYTQDTSLTNKTTGEKTVYHNQRDLRIYNALLCRILEKLCGKLSHNKFISEHIIFSNKECLLGFMDAYIGGDGSVDKKSNSITMGSVSKKMLLDIQQIMNNIGVHSYMKKYKKTEFNNRGSKDIKQLYFVNVRNNEMKKLAGMLNIKIKYKNDACKNLIEKTFKWKHYKKELLIPNEVDGVVVMEPREGRFKDTLFNRIKSIEEVPNTTEFAYDLTIADTRTFNLYTNLCGMDSFHSAGIGGIKTNVTRGVPRMQEILALTTDMKTPSLTIYLKEEEEENRELAIRYLHQIEYTKLKDLVDTMDIYFDPDNLHTLIEQDKESMSLYQNFEQRVDKCLPPSGEKEETYLKWVLRMELNREKMYEKQITMDDIHFTLSNIYQKTIQCVYSDYNADKLIFRIRMKAVKEKDSKEKKASLAFQHTLDQSDQIYLMKNFQHTLMKNVILRGVKNIQKAILRKNKDSLTEVGGTYKKKETWILDTIGTNLLDILALNFIDTKRTTTNDIMEVYRTLGIEATRKILLTEMLEVIQFDGSYLNYHHPALLSDRMTYYYKPVAVSRHGIINGDADGSPNFIASPISKASFETTATVLQKSARFSLLDPMTGISANVMCGQEGNFGTNSFQLLLDLPKIATQKALHHTDTETDTEDKDTNIEEKMNRLFQIEVGECSQENLKFVNQVSNLAIEDTGKLPEDYNPFQ
jgi:DNA-directed RNA polymerase II subunit RPB1